MRMSTESCYTSEGARRKRRYGLNMVMRQTQKPPCTMTGRKVRLTPVRPQCRGITDQFGIRPNSPTPLCPPGLQTSHDNRLKHADTICFPSVFRLFVELAITTYNSAAVSKVVLSVLLRLLQMLRSSPPAVLGVCSEVILAPIFCVWLQHCLKQCL